MASKSKAKNKVTEGIAHIQATFNNTIITLTNMAGDVIGQCSAGQVGFKNARKGTPFAAQLAAEQAAKKARDEYGLRGVGVHVMGGGAGRDPAIKSLRGSGLEIKYLKDCTKLPHNGCRPRKKRRV